MADARGRAQWIALRTLHRTVHPVGRDGGQDVYVLDDVRLVLPGGARHFRRLITCRDCRREFADYGRPIFGRDDLRHAPSGGICQECAQRRIR